MKITEEDQQKYYKDNPDKFKEVKVRVIYIAFNPTPGKAATDGKKLVTEAEAKAKIEDLAKQIQGGRRFWQAGARTLRRQDLRRQRWRLRRREAGQRLSASRSRPRCSL